MFFPIKNNFWWTFKKFNKKLTPELSAGVILSDDTEESSVVLHTPPQPSLDDHNESANESPNEKVFSKIFKNFCEKNNFNPYDENDSS